MRLYRDLAEERLASDHRDGRNPVSAVSRLSAVRTYPPQPAPSWLWMHRTPYWRSLRWVFTFHARLGAVANARVSKSLFLSTERRAVMAEMGHQRPSPSTEASGCSGSRLCENAGSRCQHATRISKLRSQRIIYALATFYSNQSCVQTTRRMVSHSLGRERPSASAFAGRA